MASTTTWKFPRKDYDAGKEAILRCLEHRRVIQRYKTYLKIRENPYSKYATFKAKLQLELEKAKEEAMKVSQQINQQEASSSQAR